VAGPDGPTLSVATVTTPEPGPHELLVRVRAAGVNRADLARTQQHFAAKDVNIAGLEAAGEVAAVGSEVSGFAPGDRVMAMCRDAYAEYALFDARFTLRVPDGVEWTAAAATPTWYLTAHDAIVVNGGLRQGESVLIQAAGAGVGLAGLQVARMMGAGLVLGVGRDDAKLARLRAEFGLDVAINSSREDVAAVAREATGGKGVDIVMDNVGASALKANMEAMAIGGRLIGVGRLGGRMAEIDLDLLALKRLKLIGVTFRTRSIEEKAALAARAMADLGPAISEGRLRPLVDRTFPLDEALAAQEEMRANRHLGKIVLTV
jgi:NADPH:quinone reductase-like Zn-dependent oxidoreductase